MPGAERGFTLIELIIFIVITGILATGLAAVFSTTMRGAAAPGQLTQATQIAQERMELILGSGVRLVLRHSPILARRRHSVRRHHPAMP